MEGHREQSPRALLLADAWRPPAFDRRARAVAPHVARGQPGARSDRVAEKHDEMDKRRMEEDPIGRPAQRARERYRRRDSDSYRSADRQESPRGNEYRRGPTPSAGQVRQNGTRR